MRLSPLAFCALLVLGCDTSTEPLGTLTFTRDVENTGLPALHATSGTVEHRGTFYLPCVPYHLSAHLDERGSELIEIHVVGERRHGCWTMTGQTAYLARVTQLQSGLYTIRVIHSWPQTARKDTVLTETVVVP